MQSSGTPCELQLTKTRAFGLELQIYALCTIVWMQDMYVERVRELDQYQTHTPLGATRYERKHYYDGKMLP